MEWSYRNCRAISEVYRYLSSAWLPNHYSSSGSQCAVSTKSVLRSDFLCLENATKRASRWKCLRFPLMNTPLSPWPDNVQCCVFAE